MSPSNSAQLRHAPAALTAKAMRLSASLTAHLRTIERKIPLHARYENFIGGKWIAPVKGGYFDNISPTTGQVICQIARSQAEDVELALDAAHAAAEKWGRTAVAERARALNRIADRIEEYLPFLAAVETYDNGKAVRETLNRRHAAGCRPFPLLRRLHPRPGRHSPRSTITPWPIISMNHWAWSGRSSRGTSRS